MSPEERERIHTDYVSFEERDPDFLGTLETQVAELQQFNPGELFIKTYPVKIGTQVMQWYLDRLREAGLDVGRGDSTFGYRIPLPSKRAYNRDLIIFRRK